MSQDRHLTQLPDDMQQALRTYVKRVSQLLGPALESLAVYGSVVRDEYVQGRSNLNVLLCVEHLDGERLRTLTPLLAKWKREQILTLVLTGAELQTWGTHFPLEFSDLIEDHILMAGRNPFAGLRSDQRAMEAAVARDARENVLRLRQRYVEGGASEESALILLPLSVTAVGACMRGLCRVWALSGTNKTDAAITAVCQRLGVDPAPLLEAWALRCGLISPGQLEIPRLFDRYLVGLQRVVQHCDLAETGAST